MSRLLIPVIRNVFSLGKGRKINHYLYVLCEASTTFEIGAARRSSVTEIAPKAPFLSMNRGPNGMVLVLTQELSSTE